MICRYLLAKYDIGYEMNRCISEKALGQEEEQREPEPHIRLDKVHAFQEEIARGAYQIDYDKIAENMLGLFAEEIPRFVTRAVVCH